MAQKDRGKRRKVKQDRRAPAALSAAAARHGRELLAADPALAYIAPETLRHHRSTASERDPLLGAFLEWVQTHLEAGAVPSVPEYERFMRDRFVPAYNSYVKIGWRLCVECATRFAVSDGRGDDARFCSDACSGRARNRGREKFGDGLSSAERAARKFGDRTKRHMESCAACKTGRLCPEGERLLIASTTDALDRPRGEDPEE